jgi:hypothetical protein
VKLKRGSEEHDYNRESHQDGAGIVGDMKQLRNVSKAWPVMGTAEIVYLSV